MKIKPMELSQTQKDKLLKMCNDLFKDYRFTWSTLPDTVRVEDRLFGTYSFRIHWFELVCTYLLDGVYLPDNMDINEEFNEMRVISNVMFEMFMYYNNNNYLSRKSTFFGDEHPIDRIYSKFLKL